MMTVTAGVVAVAVAHRSLADRFRAAAAAVTAHGLAAAGRTTRAAVLAVRAAVAAGVKANLAVAVAR